MKTRYWLPFAALAAFAADCGTEGTETGDSATDTFCYDCDFLANSIQVTCDNNGTTGQVDGNGNLVDSQRDDDTVTYEVAFSAWAAEVTMDVSEQPHTSSQHDETHVFPSSANIGFEADGTGDAWELVLTGTETVGGFASGSATLFGCSDLDYYNTTAEGAYKSLAFRLTASPTTDYDDATATCAIFGDQATTAFGSDCECFEEFLQTPPANPCGDHS